MTREWRVLGATTFALGIACLWLAWNTITAPSRRSDGDEGSSGSGTLEISAVDLSAGARDVVLSARTMVPGDQTTIAVTVVNSGPRAIAWSMTRSLASVGGTALSTALMLTVRTVGSSCAAFDGTILYDGPLDGAAIANAAAGRPLQAATAEILCFRTALPHDTGNEAQGGETTITLSFAADDGAAAT